MYVLTMYVLTVTPARHGEHTELMLARVELRLQVVRHELSKY